MRPRQRVTAVKVCWGQDEYHKHSAQLGPESSNAQEKATLLGAGLAMQRQVMCFGDMVC